VDGLLLLGEWQMTGVVVLVIVVVFVVLVVARMLWRFLRGDLESAAGGSLGSQFLGRGDHATKPEDWLKR
jgi:hypothetical protein